MKEQPPFYKTGTSRSPFNKHEPGHEELPKHHVKEMQKNKKFVPIINTPDHTILNKHKVDKTRALMKSFSGGKYQATRLDIHRDAPKPRGVVKPKITASTEIKPLQYKREGALRTSKHVSLSSTKKS